MRALLVAILLISSSVCVLLQASPATAKTVYVRLEGRIASDPDDVVVLTRIQTAVSITTALDEIVVWPGRYTYSNQAPLGDPQQNSMIFFERQDTGKLLRSAEGPETTIIDCEGMTRAIRVEGENIYSEVAPLRIKGFTFINGEGSEIPGGPSGGAVVGHLAGTVFIDCVFANNHAEVDGGAVWWGGQSDIVFKDCEFYGNSAGRFGGAFFFINSQLNRGVFRRCIFRDNEAGDAGGGLFIWYSQFRLHDCIVMDNRVLRVDGGYGGGVYMGAVPPDPDTLVPSMILNCSIVGNEARWGGGLAMRTREIPVSGGGTGVRKSCFVSVDNTIVAHNRRGGAVYRDADPIDGVSFSNCILGRNSGGDWVGNTDHMEGVDGNSRANPQFCDWSERDLSLCPNSPALPANRPDELLIGALESTCTSCSAGSASTGAAVLHPGHPNPFDPAGAQLRVLYNIVQRGYVRLRVYSLSGRYVATLVDGHHETGDEYVATWDGRDTHGGRVAAGVYTYRLDVDGEAVTGKIALIK